MPERFYPEIIKSKNGLQLEFQFLGKNFGKRIPVGKTQSFVKTKRKLLRKLLQRLRCSTMYYISVGPKGFLPTRYLAEYGLISC